MATLESQIVRASAVNAACLTSQVRILAVGHARQSIWEPGPPQPTVSDSVIQVTILWHFQ